MRKILLLQTLFLVLFSGAASAIQVGSVVVYSDGSAEKLFAKNLVEERWEDQRKRLIRRSTNPILPLLERREFLGGRGYVQSINRGTPESVMTLPRGSRVEFAMLRVTHDGENTARTWECQHMQTSKRAVLGKLRRVNDYACERFVVDRKLWTKKFRERRDISYSPELGLVVDYKRRTRTKTVTRKLIAILSPDKANYRNISKAIEKARPSKRDR